ncbi:phage portal protein [Solibacillus silvestris]
MSKVREIEFITVRDAMDAFKIYIPFIEKNGVNGELITQMIYEHAPVKAQLKRLRDRYEASKEGVPILTREIMSSTGNVIEASVNNKLNNAYDSDIVDTKNGYFLGNPINYAVEKNKIAKADSLISEIDKLRTRDNLPDKDATLGKRTSIGGYGARLCYISLENDKPTPRITNLKPEEVIFLYKETMAEPRYSLHYYDTVRLNVTMEKEPVTVADFYDDVHMYRFVRSDSDFVLEDVKIHGFQYNPLFGVENNDELDGEAKKILNLVDAFDRTLSDASNEIEASRLAILLLQNIGMDKEDIEKMKASGILEYFGQDGKASYLTKDVNDSMIENHLNRLNQNIMRFAKSIDFTDEKFSSNLSGIAILFKTMGLEHKAIIAENKMRSSLQYQMKVLCSAWALLGLCDAEDYLKIYFNFTRNLPANRKEEAEIVNLLSGQVSQRTLLSYLSTVDDIEAEIEAMQQERMEFGEQLPPLVPIGKETKQSSADDPEDEDNDDLQGAK